MFKRIEKKLTRKKEEEELGITEEIKEAIGFNDLDSSSDESEASSSGSSPKISSKRKRLFDDDELDASSDAGSEGQESGVSDDSDDDEPAVQMTIEEALHNPLYIVSIQPDIRGCIVCPRKLLKNEIMTSVHMRSQAHQRRMSKFREATGSAKPDEDAQELLSIVFASTPLRPKPLSDEPAPLSKRATKRIAKFEKMKTKRRKHKAAKARSMAAREAKKLETAAGSESGTDDATRTPEPPKKKPKLDLPSSSGKLVKQHPPPTKPKPDDRPDGVRLKRQPRSPRVSQVTVSKMSVKSKPVEKRRG